MPDAPGEYSAGQRYVCNAPAKLNLFLHITGRRDDGYHELQTIFQFVDWCDELEFTLIDSDRILIANGLPGVKAEDNLVFKAAEALRACTGCRRGVSIAIRKQIPMGAGLGGGSSNAATTLVALNTLWELNLSKEQLMELGGKLGADVPVFVHGETCWAEGTGGDFSPVELPALWYLILRPDVSVATADMFSAPELTRQCSPITIRDFLAGHGQNVFEPVVASRYPAVANALRWLHGATEALRSESLKRDSPKPDSPKSRDMGSADRGSADLPTRDSGSDSPFLGDSGSRSSLSGRVAMSGTGSCIFVSCETENQALDLLEQKPGDLTGWAVPGRQLSPLYRGG
ncbi:MAG: 4-(cytidine 5'-diphospho)-2-C-methyl-D-erythritol kinase [Gammaproteobacteria bacterium]|nr:4-(cytidine 5'-diphospho)-2-C-methyl-D-erythritol kinase [Gammaproteobacteria bacterium]